MITLRSFLNNFHGNHTLKCAEDVIIKLDFCLFVSIASEVFDWIGEEIVTTHSIRKSY